MHTSQIPTSTCCNHNIFTGVAIGLTNGARTGIDATTIVHSGTSRGSIVGKGTGNCPKLLDGEPWGKRRENIEMLPNMRELQFA